MNRKSRLYRSLKWMYQPLKAAKALYQELNYIPRRQTKLRECKNSQGFTGLHIGCGPFYMPGWVNTDVLGTPNIDFPLDISSKLPLPNNCFDVIYGSEVLEHIDLAEARQFLRESQRILKPGGVMRLTTPDLHEVCKIFLGQKEGVKVGDFGTVWLEGEFSPEIWINCQFRAWGHKHLWTWESLSTELTAAGFTQIQRCEPHKTKSDKPELDNLDNRYGDDAPSWLFASTLIVEAQKPVTSIMGDANQSTERLELSRSV